MHVYCVPYVDIIQDDQSRWNTSAPFFLNDTAKIKVEELSFEDRIGFKSYDWPYEHCIKHIFKILDLYECANGNIYQVPQCDIIFGKGRIYPSTIPPNLDNYFNDHLVYILNYFLKIIIDKRFYYRESYIEVSDPYDYTRYKIWYLFNDMMRQKLYNVGIIYGNEKKFYTNYGLTESILYLCKNVDSNLYTKFKVLLSNDEYDKNLFDMYNALLSCGIL
jgi:hypothetical protein